MPGFRGSRFIKTRLAVARRDKSPRNENAGENAADEERGNGGLCYVAHNDHDDARRNDGPESATRGLERNGEADRIAAALHGGDHHGAGRYGETMHGFSNDWAYMQVGAHSLLPEISGAGRDYDEDGYVTQYEILRWIDEEKDGVYFSPWQSYPHPQLGEVEIGGYRGLPQGVDELLEKECGIHYQFLLHIADLSPLLRIEKLTSDRVSADEHRVTAVLQNQGFLSTYVTRKALEIRLDYPIIARIRVEGGELSDEDPAKKVGHILGKLAYIRRWGSGADESHKTVTWTVKGRGPLKVSVEAWAKRAGRDEKTITIG